MVYRVHDVNYVAWLLFLGTAGVGGKSEVGRGLMLRGRKGGGNKKKKDKKDKIICLPPQPANDFVEHSSEVKR